MRIFMLALLSLPACLAAAADDPYRLSEQSRDIIQTFANRLQSELQEAMATGGPINAIDVCRIQAPQIAAELSTDGWLVKRTSLKPRNPLNAPDEFERKTLVDFEEKKAGGWAVEKLAYYKMNEVGNATEFRYMKAIPTRTMCLVCHGENIPADVLEKLDAAYPDDRARGYREGDIRGAFSLRRRMQIRPKPEADHQAVSPINSFLRIAQP